MTIRRHSFGLVLLAAMVACSSRSQENNSASPSRSSVVAQNTPQGYFHTNGSLIVDGNNAPVQFTGINWYGFETTSFAPHGLWARTLESLVAQVHDLGFNVLRIPYSNQMFDPESQSKDIDFKLNPGLVGRRPIEILDLVIELAGQYGLRVILDRHRPDAISQSSLWYTGQVGEDRWIRDWVMLADRYKTNATVIGVDLHNEPKDPATWGDGNAATDWRLAAERAGAAIQAANSDLLIIVEGIETFGQTSAWWGGNLRGVREAAVRLPGKDHVIYSTHEYPASVFEKPWFKDPKFPSNLDGLWSDTFGYIAQSNIAPVFVGEFGTRLESASDKTWFQYFLRYISDNHLSFTFWALNPDSYDTGGILNDDWTSVHKGKMESLRPILAPLLP